MYFLVHQKPKNMQFSQEIFLKYSFLLILALVVIIPLSVSFGLLIRIDKNEYFYNYCYRIFKK